MLNEENKKLCEKVLLRYGIKNQMVKVIEECAELQEAVSHAFQPDFDIYEVQQNLHEELIDVIVVCQQMLLAECMSMDDVNAMAKVKLDKALGKKELPFTTD